MPASMNMGSASDPLIGSAIHAFLLPPSPSPFSSLHHPPLCSYIPTYPLPAIVASCSVCLDPLLKIPKPSHGPDTH